MKTKHTPGPWTMEQFFYKEKGESGFAILDEKTRVLAWLFSTSPNSFGKEVSSGLPTGSNARLIALAPELLKALKKAVVMLNIVGMPGDHSIDDLEKMEQLIAKAEGDES